MEKDVQSKIIKYLKARGYYVVKTIRTNRTGTPDILACSPRGSFIGIEVKDIGKKHTATPLQQDNLDMIRKCNGIAILADCVDDLIKEGL